MRNIVRYFSKLIPQYIKNIYHLIIALFSVAYFGYPAKNLRVIGVTGTDGKTTTSTILYEMLKEAGYKTGMVSTVSAYIGNERIDTGFHVTAPDPWMLQRLLRKMVDSKIEYVVLEATSHGLDQHRLFGANIEVAILTNITHEHLDYHKTYDNYVKAKSKIFEGVKLALVNKADNSFNLVKAKIGKDVSITAYDEKSATYEMREIINSKFPEKYNRQNATAAYLAANYLGVSNLSAIRALKNFKGVEGRMENIVNSRGFRLIIDFAHTPNALENVLTTLKNQKKGSQRLISVFGCASERDVDKRPIMGKISTKLADVSVFTAEDPRYEDPQVIIDQIITGVKENLKPKKYFAFPDRFEAIDFAINKLAKKGDTVVVCGKGHEQSMNIGGKEYSWSDKKAVEYALRRKRYIYRV